NGIAYNCFPQSDIGSRYREDLSDGRIPSAHGYPEFFCIYSDVIRCAVFQNSSFLFKEVFSKNQPAVAAFEGFLCKPIRIDDRVGQRCNASTLTEIDGEIGPKIFVAEGILHAANPYRVVVGHPNGKTWCCLGYTICPDNDPT